MAAAVLQLPAFILPYLSTLVCKRQLAASGAVDGLHQGKTVPHLFHLPVHVPIRANPSVQVCRRAGGRVQEQVRPLAPE